MQDSQWHRPPLASTEISATDLAARLNLRRSRPGEWRGNCPACGYVGAAVLSERGSRPLLWCASCQDSAGLAAALRQAAGGVLPPRAEPKDAVSDAERRAAKLARAAALWASAEPITADCPAGRYLRHRRIEHVMESRALRWRSDTPHPAGGRRVALLAKITATDGTLAGLQRIYLDRDGNKATVEPVKASLGLIAGGAVRLQDCSAELVVGEGIETSAAAGALLSRPAWAAVSCGNLGRSLILPPEIRSIIIAVDADEPGQAAARAAWQRWAREGRRVRLATPKEAGADFSDIVMGAGQ